MLTTILIRTIATLALVVTVFAILERGEPDRLRRVLAAAAFALFVVAGITLMEIVFDYPGYRP